MKNRRFCFHNGKVLRFTEKQRNNLYFKAYTDGSCLGNPGIGGWGWYAISSKINQTSPVITWKDNGGSKHTTNQQMELRAVAEFLKFCPSGSKIDVFTDSNYVLGGIIGKVEKLPNKIESDLVIVESEPQGWLRRWVSENAKLECKLDFEYWIKNPTPKNEQEWYEIHQSLLRHSKMGSVISFAWVKAHVGIEGNEIADKLANIYAKTI